MCLTGHTYRADKYSYGDNNIRVKVVVQATDAITNDNNALRSVSVGARLGIPMIFRNLQVKIVRSLNEIANLILSPSLNSTSG